MDMLHKRGYYVTKLTKQGRTVEEMLGIGKSQFKVKVVARLCAQLASMLRSGVPIGRALEMLGEESDHKGLQEVLKDVHGSINEGASFSQAMKPHQERFPVLFHSMVEAGEASGTLDACLERAGISFTRAAKLNAKAKGASIYPSIIIVVLIGMLIVMLTMVVPQFAEVYADGGADLPAFTQGLLSLSEWLRTQWHISVSIVVASIIVVTTFLKTEFGRYRFDKFKTRVPVISKLTNKIYAARFTRSLSSLTAAGVNLPNALEITSRTVINTFLEKHIVDMVEDVKKGLQLSDAMERMGQLPPLCVSITKIGEESGELEDMLGKIAEYYDEEADNAIQALLTMMEPALILIMAVVVVPILFGVLQPMFGMLDVVANM
jgi:type IV pilus assembly protein PilC